MSTIHPRERAGRAGMRRQVPGAPAHRWPPGSSGRLLLLLYTLAPKQGCCINKVRAETVVQRRPRNGWKCFPGQIIRADRPVSRRFCGTASSAGSPPRRAAPVFSLTMLFRLVECKPCRSYVCVESAVNPHGGRPQECRVVLRWDGYNANIML